MVHKKVPSYEDVEGKRKITFFLNKQNNTQVCTLLPFVVAINITPHDQHPSLFSVGLQLQGNSY